MSHRVYFIPTTDWEAFQAGELLKAEASYLCFSPESEDFSRRRVPSKAHFIEVAGGKARFVPSFLDLAKALFIAPEPILLLGLPDSVAEVYAQCPDTFDLAECIKLHY